MRRKFGILFLIGITVLAGTQEAAHQFDGLKSSLKNFTRASLWSGLIVYAQPVNDGNLPTPQIYYLMPPPQQPQPAAPAAQQVLLADNGHGATANKPEAGNSHAVEAARASNPETADALAMREVEEAAKAELTLNRLPLNLLASHLPTPKAAPKVAPEPGRVRVFEEIAKREPHAARRLRQEADEMVRVFVKELDAAHLVAEAARLVAEGGQLERLKTKSLGEAEVLHRRMDLRVGRRPAPLERLERIKVIVPHAGRRAGIALPEMSSIGCEKTRTKPEASPAPPPAPVAKRSVQMPGESWGELGVPEAPHPVGTTWTLNCDTEPEQQ